MTVYLRIIILILLTLSWTSVSGQAKTKTYIGRGDSHGPLPCYRVTVIDINSDSTYLLTDYGCGDKKSWKKYKEWKAETSIGKIKKWDDYYRMTEYREDRPTRIEFKLRVTNNKIIFWDVNGEPKKKFKGMTLKRASL